MALSPSERLQNLALSLASRDNKGLDLGKTAGAAAWQLPLPEGIVQTGHQVLVAGAVWSELVLQAVRTVTETGYAMVLEPQPALLDQVSTSQDENGMFLRSDLHEFRTNPKFVQSYLQNQALMNLEDYQSFQQQLVSQQLETPLVPDQTVDVILYPYTWNRLECDQAILALKEAWRVLRPGGTFCCHVLLVDEPATRKRPAFVHNLPVRTAPLEAEVVELLEQAGFIGVHFAARAALPFSVLEGVEYRAYVLVAEKPLAPKELDQGHAVMYKGPFAQVTTERGQTFGRGERVAVSSGLLEQLTRPPYASHFEAITPYVAVPEAVAPAFDASTMRLRDPKVTKGQRTLHAPQESNCCDTDSGCC